MTGLGWGRGGGRKEGRLSDAVADVAAGGEEEAEGSAVAIEQRERARGWRGGGERRSESTRRTACRGYCDGNVISEPDCSAQGSVQVIPSASNLG